MALTFSRWVMLAVVCCALTAALVTKKGPLRSRPVVDSTLAVLETQKSQAEVSAAQLAARVRL